MLIATLPAVHRERLLEKIIAHPAVLEVRYNTGVVSAYSPLETLSKIAALAAKHGKKFWVDLKCRQLRIEHWAVPDYGTIILNHAISVDMPARIYFRGDDWSEIKAVRGRKIYVDPPPRNAVGAGQAVNIHGNNLVVEGYMTAGDYEYIQAACSIGVANFMLSFVESAEDVNVVRNAMGLRDRSELVLKIESPKGLELVSGIGNLGCRLMAARDDLMINIGENKASMLPALESIVKHDPDAILASRIFSGLESGSATLSDIADLRLMQQMGYHHFMLSDGICSHHFEKAMAAWQDYLDVFPEAGGVI